MGSSLTVYKASAGSGKTFTLTAAYIALLLSEDSITNRNILAVTFTNKATAEMKERILQELWELANNGHKTGFADHVLQLLPHVSWPELRRRAARTLHAIVHDYDHFYVETIDAFFQSLLVTLAHEMGLSMGFRVELDDNSVIQKAVDRLLLNVDQNEAVYRWVEDYIDEQISRDKSWNVSHELNKLAVQTKKERFMLNESQLCHRLKDDEYMGLYIGQLRKLEKVAKEQLIEEARLFDDFVTESGGYGQFSYGKSLGSFVTALRSGENKEPGKKILSYISKADSLLLSKDLDNPMMVAKASGVSAGLSRLERVRKSAEYIMNSCAMTLQNIRPLRLIEQIDKEITRINTEENRVMLARTPMLFENVVGADDASFVFERVGNQFRHIMIDEFQDTSTLQWNNFKRLLIENMSQGNSCLLVGDVKQAIYRFRGGDWKILEHIDRGIGHQAADIKHLDTNYRSASNVIDFNNALFPKAARILDKADGDSSISNIYADVRQNHNQRKGGRVEVHFNVLKDKKAGSDNLKKKYSDGEEGEETTSVARQLADKIHCLHDDAGISYGKMAILVRRQRDATALLNELASLGETDLPIVSDEAFILSSSTAIKLLINALRFLDDESDTAARSFICRARTGRIMDTGPQGSKDIAALESTAVSADWINEELPADFSSSREELRAMPLYELCEHLIFSFGLQENEEAAPFLLHFLDAVMEHMGNGNSGLHSFLENWEETISKQSVTVGDIDGIRIMTIHKAKGLAFHTVFLPACHWDIERDRNNDILWCTSAMEPFNALPIVPISKGKSMVNSVYGNDYCTEHHDTRTESLNLLYVAFTRAEQNLFVWADAHSNADFVSKPNSTTIGDLLWACIGERDYVTGDIEAPRKQERGEDTKSKKLNPLKFKAVPERPSFVSYAPHVAFRQSAAAAQFIADKGNEMTAAYIDRGKLLHRVFSNIFTLRDVDKALIALEQDGVLTNMHEAESLRRLIETRMESPLVASWFSAEWDVYNECSILTRDQEGQLQIRRPDRVLVKGSNAVVVDFKFGKNKPEYRQQVADYCRMLRHMGYDTVNGYIWYVYKGDIDNVVFEDKESNDRSSSQIKW